MTASDCALAAPSSSPPRACLPRWLIYSACFWGGLTIMVLEISGFRVLPTYLGSSVIVTGTLLTAFMMLMSAGYYVGGLSSRQPRGVRRLFASLMGAALYTVVVSGQLLEPIAALVVSWRGQLPDEPYLRGGLSAALLTLALYGPPVFALSEMSPHWIRLGTAASDDEGGVEGRETGRFMSLSTLGSIVGTIAGSFLLVPFFGVHVSGNVVAVVLFVVAAIGWLKQPASSPRVGPAPASEAF